jgi:hypothetical protein
MPDNDNNRANQPNPRDVARYRSRGFALAPAAIAAAAATKKWTRHAVSPS